MSSNDFEVTDFGNDPDNIVSLMSDCVTDNTADYELQEDELTERELMINSMEQCLLNGLPCSAADYLTDEEMKRLQAAERQFITASNNSIMEVNSYSDTHAVPMSLLKSSEDILKASLYTIEYGGMRYFTANPKPFCPNIGCSEDHCHIYVPPPPELDTQTIESKVDATAFRIKVLEATIDKLLAVRKLKKLDKSVCVSSICAKTDLNKFADSKGNLFKVSTGDKRRDKVLKGMVPYSTSNPRVCSVGIYYTDKPRVILCPGGHILTDNTLVLRTSEPYDIVKIVSGKRSFRLSYEVSKAGLVHTYDIKIHPSMAYKSYDISFVLEDENGKLFVTPALTRGSPNGRAEEYSWFKALLLPYRKSQYNKIPTYLRSIVETFLRTFKDYELEVKADNSVVLTDGNDHNIILKFEGKYKIVSMIGEMEDKEIYVNRRKQALVELGCVVTEYVDRLDVLTSDARRAKARLALARCGDVESHPGPMYDEKCADYVRQTIEEISPDRVLSSTPVQCICMDPLCYARRLVMKIGDNQFEIESYCEIYKTGNLLLDYDYLLMEVQCVRDTGNQFSFFCLGCNFIDSMNLDTFLFLQSILPSNGLLSRISSNNLFNCHYYSYPTYSFFLVPSVWERIRNRNLFIDPVLWISKASYYLGQPQSCEYTNNGLIIRTCRVAVQFDLTGAILFGKHVTTWEEFVSLARLFKEPGAFELGLED